MTTEEERFVEAFRVFENQVAEVTHFWFASSTLKEVPKTNPATLKAINRSPAFWIAVRLALEYQTIIGLGKIFGQRKSNPHNIDSFFRVLRETCFVVFSKESLAERKRKLSPDSHDWLAEYLEGVYVPAVRDIVHLQVLARPHHKTYETQFEALRNQHVAHTEITDSSVRWEMFQKTRIPDLENAIVFLNRLRRAIWNLQFNGIKPEIDPSPQSGEGLMAKDSLRESWDEEYIVGETRKALELLTLGATENERPRSAPAR
jgi:hypothetical protein